MKQGKCAQWHNGLTCVHWSIKPLGEGCWGCGCRGWIEFNIPLVIELGGLHIVCD